MSSRFSARLPAAFAESTVCADQLLHQQSAAAAPAGTLCMGMSDVAVALILVVLIFATIVGNVLVVLAVAVYRRMRTFTNVLLVSLSSADLLVGLLVMPFSLADLLHRHQWKFGLLVCKLWSTVDVMLCTASILNLCVISLDRYFAITTPLRYTRTRSQKLAAVVVVAVWILSVLISSPPWFVPQWRIQLEDGTCGYAKATAYRVYSALGSFYIPLLIMLFVYYKIFRVASNRERLLNVDRRGSRSMQMWQQQARRTARAAAAAAKTSAVTGSTTRLTAAVTGVGLVGGQSPNKHCQLTPERSDEYDDDGVGVGVGGGGGGVRRRLDEHNHHALYDSPSPSLHQSNCVHHHNKQRKPPMRLRFQRNATADEEDDEDELDWRAAERSTAALRELAAGAPTPSDPTAAAKITMGLSRTSLVDCGAGGVGGGGATANDGPPTRANSTANMVPLLTEQARRYFERTVPWSLLNKANEYYVNSKPLRPSREKLMYLKERKALKTIGIVVSGFVICWLPFFILYLIEAVCFFYSPQTPHGPALNLTAESEFRRDSGWTSAVSLLSQRVATVRPIDSYPASGPAAGRQPHSASHSGVTAPGGGAAVSAAAAATANPPRLDSLVSETLLVCAVPPIIADIFLWLGYSNSVLNPLIYTFYNRDFRRCFKDILSGGCLRRNAANRRMSVRRLHQTRL